MLEFEKLDTFAELEEIQLKNSNLSSDLLK